MDVPTETGFPDTTGLMHTRSHGAQCSTYMPWTGSSQMGLQCWDRELNTGPRAEPRNNWQLVPTAKGKISFIQWSVNVYINDIPGHTPFPGVYPKLTPRSMLCIFFSFYFVLMLCHIVCSDYVCMCVCVFKRKNKRERVSRDHSWTTEKTCSKHCIKKIKMYKEGK